MTLGLVALFFVLFFGFATFAIRAMIRQSRERESVLAEVARHVDGKHDDSTVWGTSAGVEVKLSLTSRGTGSDRKAWTEVDADLPAKYPLAIHVREHGFFDQGQIAKGKMVDVQLGDAAFDTAFLVEVAPEDVAVHLLDAEARALITRLAADQRLELSTVDVNGKKVLRLAVRTWLDTYDAATAALDGVARIASRVREAYADADSAVEQTAEGTPDASPYRPIRDAGAEREVAARREEQVAAVEQARTTREQQVRNVVIVIALVALGAMGLWFYSEVKRTSG